MSPSDAAAAALRAAANACLAVVLAPCCACCAAPLDRPLDGTVCPICWSEVPLIAPPICGVCGDPLVPRPGDPASRCSRCCRSAGVTSRARAAGLYHGRLRDIIHAFKYDARRSLAKPLAGLMRSQGASVLAGADAAVAVPLHPSRLRERGFNQARDLAVGLGLPVVRALRRLKATPPQAALPAAARRRNVADAFVARRVAASLRGRVVVVVDDVMTTGATIEACAVVLRRAGAREVRSITAARVVQPQR